MNIKNKGLEFFMNFLCSVKSVMRYFFVIILVLIVGFGGISFTISESNAEMRQVIKDPTEKEKILIEHEGYHAEEYHILPFGSKHYFYKTDNHLGLGEISFGRCVMSATYPIGDGESVKVSMKFPQDLVWPGGYDNSTFFLGKGGHHGYTNKTGKIVTKNTETIWENFEPSRDSDFITIEFESKDQISHLMVNMTTLPDLSNSFGLNTYCPAVVPPMKYDYYDRVESIDTQRKISEMMGFRPDTFICENNLIGAIKATNDTEVCVKSESKVKLVERGWAKDFSKNEN